MIGCPYIVIICGLISTGQAQQSSPSARARIGILLENGTLEMALLNFVRHTLALNDYRKSQLEFKLPSKYIDSSTDAWVPRFKTCDLLSESVVAIILPHNPLFAAQAASYSHRFNVPLISFNARSHKTTKPYKDNTKKDGIFTLRLRPDERLAGKIAADLVQHFQWRSMAVLYEDPDDLFELNDLLMLSSTSADQAPQIELLKLPPEDEIKPQFELFVKKLVEHPRLVVHIRLHRVRKFLKTASQMRMNDSKYSFIFTNLDLHTLKLHREHDLELNCNITAFKLIDVDADLYEDHNSLWSHYRHQHQREFTSFGVDDELLSTTAAVILDTMQLILSATKRAVTCPMESSSCALKIHYEPKQLTCYAQNDYDPDTDSYPPPWQGGTHWQQLFANEEFDGATGHVSIDETGQRRNVSFTVLQYKAAREIKLGKWTESRGYDANHAFKKPGADAKNKTIRVVVLLEEPFVMRRDESNGILKGNSRYEGYLIDLINGMSKEMNITFELHEVKDGQYGSMNDDTGEWNGMVGELQRNEADMALGAFTISSARSEVIDFTVPYMHLGISILFKQPANAESKLFAFLQPLSLAVWVYLALSYITVSMTMWLLARFTPYEWYNPHPTTAFDTADSQFTLLNSLWFTVGSLMQQGSDVAPRAFSTRLVAAVWWFFTVVVISSYTAKLAAFLTVARMSTDIENAADLAKQEKVKYGSLTSGSTMNFFAESQIPVYERMWQFMQQSGSSAFVNSSKEGIARVKSGDYAYLMESSMLEYYAERDCDLMQIGGLIDSKGYGIGLRKGSPILSPASQAILRLQETTVLEQTKVLWWKELNDGGKCKPLNILSSQPSARKLKNIGGIFFILFGGLMLSFTVGLCEFIYKLRTDPALAKLSLCSMLFRELTGTGNTAQPSCTQSPTTPRRRIRRVSTLMALPMYPTANTNPPVLHSPTQSPHNHNHPHSQLQQPAPKRAQLLDEGGHEHNHIDTESDDDQLSAAYHNRVQQPHFHSSPPKNNQHFHHHDGYARGLQADLAVVNHRHRQPPLDDRSPEALDALM